MISGGKRWSRNKDLADSVSPAYANLTIPQGNLATVGGIALISRIGDSRMWSNDILDPERVAYWYFRLNGFLLMENFILHPRSKGSQRTDADLLGVRFPHRAEGHFDALHDIMQDDFDGLSLSRDLIDVVMAEIKRNQPCTLNDAWIRPSRENVDRAIASIGCLPKDRVAAAASEVYGSGAYCGDSGLRIRMVAVGRIINPRLRETHPKAIQIVWRDLWGFMWRRFRAYKKQKRDVSQWPQEIRSIQCVATKCGDQANFVGKMLRRMRVHDSG